MEQKRLIYALCCPFTDDIHYIGKTTEGMLRPLSHLKESHSDKINEWVSNLKIIGHSPNVRILEYVPKEIDLDSREIYWIQSNLKKGSLLLNSTLVSPLTITTNLDDLLGVEDGFNMLKIGKFIKEKRKAVNMNQPRFASASGVALTVLRKIEQGKTNINLISVLQVLRMFGVTLDIVKLKK